MLRTIFVHEGEEVSTGLRNLRNEQVCNLYFVPHINDHRRRKELIRHVTCMEKEMLT